MTQIISAATLLRIKVTHGWGSAGAEERGDNIDDCGHK